MTSPERFDPALPVALESRRPRALAHEKLPAPVDVNIGYDALAAGLRTETCPQCGTNPAGQAKERTLQYVPPWVYAGLLVNVVVVAILYYAGRQRVTTSLPLCEDCEAADKRGRNLMGLSYFGVLLAPLVAALAASPFDLEGWAAAIGFVAGMVGAVTTTVRMKPQVIAVRQIDKKQNFVRLRAAPTWRGVLEREAPSSLRVGR